MAGPLPISGLKLSDIITEINGTYTKLSECTTNATGTFDGAYYSAPADSIKDFRGYQNTVVPDPPTLLQSSLISQTTFTLAWTAPVSDGGTVLTQYRIYKNGTIYANTGNTNTSNNVTGQTAGNTNTWTVKAVNNVGDSVASSGLSVTMASAGVSVTAISISSTGKSTANDACPGSPYTTRYITGSGTPTNGDVMYEDNPGITIYNGKNFYFGDSSYTFIIDNNGIISTRATCVV